jgi:hypothetical protein
LVSIFESYCIAPYSFIFIQNSMVWGVKTKTYSKYFKIILVLITLLCNEIG